MIVVDASPAVLALFNDGDARATSPSRRWPCPHRADSEITHALRSQVLRGAVTAAQVEQTLAVWAGLGVERIGVTALSRRIWELRENLTAYDATHVAVAEALEAQLVAADARLVRAPGVRCPVTVIRG